MLFRRPACPPKSKESSNTWKKAKSMGKSERFSGCKKSAGAKDRNFDKLLELPLKESKIEALIPLLDGLGKTIGDDSVRKDTAVKMLAGIFSAAVGRMNILARGISAAVPENLRSVVAYHEYIEGLTCSQKTALKEEKLAVSELGLEKEHACWLKKIGETERY